MIFILLLIAIIGFSVSAVAMFKQHGYIVTTLLALVVTCACLWLTAANDTHNLGMHLTNTQTTTRLQSSYTSELPFLAYKQLGTKHDAQERVYGYRHVGDAKHYRTKHAHFHVTVKSTDHAAHLVTTVKRYQFNNNAWHLLFLGTKPKRTRSTDYVFQIPQSWLVLASNQAEKLPQAAKKLQAAAIPVAKQEIKRQATAAVTKQVKAKVAADPTLMQDPEQLGALQKSVTTNVERQALPRIKRAVMVQAKAAIVKQLKHQLE